MFNLILGGSTQQVDQVYIAKFHQSKLHHECLPIIAEKMLVQPAYPFGKYSTVFIAQSVKVGL